MTPISHPENRPLPSVDFYRAAAADPHMDAGQVQQWLARGESPNCDDGEGWTVLHLFAQHGNTAGVKALLEAGANPNLVGRSGLSALHVAHNAEIAEQLIAAGANVNAEGLVGSTPLHTALDADYHAAGRDGAAIVGTIRALIAAGANVNAIGRYAGGRTPLDQADRIDDPDLRDQVGAVLTAAGGVFGRDLTSHRRPMSSEIIL